ncbi:ETO1-like protein [Vigna angularis]|uniref:ETO1-like protein n=1 Tax=Phaseolus angularis TaxID=3914 RepID=A0A8T0JXW1_PHAAN|nr:ETO1-like protein [Vigna angularis]
MRSFFLAESCKETHPNALNPQSWLQIERGKLPKLSSYPSSASIESLVKVPQPAVRPFYKPADYVFKGLGEVKLMRRSLQGAWQKANTVHEKIIFGAWLKYEKQEEELIADLLANCGKCAKEFAPVDIASHLPFDVNCSWRETEAGEQCSENLDLRRRQVREEEQEWPRECQILIAQQRDRECRVQLGIAVCHIY